MTHFLNYIYWAPNEVLFHIGSFGVRWYGLCWLIGIVLAIFIVKKLYKEQNIKDELFDPLFIYCFIGILVGARLGHCLFYEPEVWLSSWQRVLQIFIPIHIFPDGSWKYTGYTGLASHGGTIGLMIALWLYCRKTGVKLWTVLDNIAIATPITACFIRLGNLMNSEIVGKVTDVPWAFIFANGDPAFAHEPRHPGQLYEAIAYFCFFFIGWAIYRIGVRREGVRSKEAPSNLPKGETTKGSEGTKERGSEVTSTKKIFAPQVGTGFFFGLCLTLIFTFRFFIEYTKEVQVDFESGMMFNMGQLLSVPFIILGLVCMIRSLTPKPLSQGEGSR